MNPEAKLETNKTENLPMTKCTVEYKAEVEAYIKEKNTTFAKMQRFAFKVACGIKSK